MPRSLLASQLCSHFGTMEQMFRVAATHRKLHPHIPPDRQNCIQNQHPRSTTSRLCQLYLSSTTMLLQPKLIMHTSTYSVASKVSSGSKFYRKHFDPPNFPLHLRHPEYTVKSWSYLAQIPLYLILNTCNPQSDKSLVCALTFPAAPDAQRQAAGLRK